MSQGMMESSDMLEEHTPLFDSLSFALLIPFAICFILIFLVCCFADQIKDICRMPSPLPASYLTAEHSRPRRHSRRSRQRSRRQSEEVRNLILSEEGRSRNVSESSSTDLIVSSSNGQTDRQIPSTITNNMATISEMPDNIQTHNSLPSTSDSNKDNLRFVTINPAPHSVVRSNSKNGEKVNFLRNLSLNSSALTLPSLPENSVNSNSSQGKSANTPVSKKSSGSVTPVDSSTSGPRALNDYLTSVLPTTDLTTITCENEVSKKETQSTVDDSQT